jgi:Leucine-rich repeat (LRR) protein
MPIIDVRISEDRCKARLLERMIPEEVEQAITTAKDNRATVLSFKHRNVFFLPDSIGNLTNLTELDLTSNRLTSIPQSIRNLTNLTELDLSNNQLTSIPEWIGNLTNLTYLSLSNNQLTSIPEWIGNLTNLTKLDLSTARSLILEEGRELSLTGLEMQAVNGVR